MPLLLYLSLCTWGFNILYIAFCVWKAVLNSVSCKTFVILNFLPLYVKVTHFGCWCWGSPYVCFLWGRWFLLSGVLNSLLCSMFWCYFFLCLLLFHLVDTCVVDLIDRWCLKVYVRMSSMNSYVLKYQFVWASYILRIPNFCLYHVLRDLEN
jgi:hypothetical protein